RATRAGQPARVRRRLPRLQRTVEGGEQGVAPRADGVAEATAGAGRLAARGLRVGAYRLVPTTTVAAGTPGPPGRRVLPEDLGRPLGAQILGHVVVRGADLAGLCQLPHRLRGRLAARPGRHDAPGAVVAAVGVPGDLLDVDA